MSAQSKAEASLKRVGIWIRVSTEDQAKGESPEHHEKRAQQYASSRGWDVIETYRLDGVSGKAVLDHPETQRMLQDIKSGRINGLIFSKLARLARNSRELLTIADHFQAAKADLISLQESIDTSTPIGRLFYTFFAALAEWEREEIADRVRVSVPIRAKLGKPLGGQAPFGYEWRDRRLVPSEKEAPVRRLIYETFLKHQRLKAVARDLNDAGYRTRNGSLFSNTTIERLLRDSTAKGVHLRNYTRSLGQRKKWVIKPETEWITTEVEPIVSTELWNACVEILDGNYKPRKKGRCPVHLFAGVTYCHCGTKMYVPSNSPKYVCKDCRNKIPADDLEAIFHEQLKGFLMSPTKVLEYLERADAALKEKEKLLKTLEAERNRSKDEMDKIYRLYAENRLTADGFSERYDPHQHRCNQLNDEIPRLQGEVDYVKICYFSSDQIFADAKEFYLRWPELDRDEKRQVIERIVERIIIGKGDVKFTLSYFPSPSGIDGKKGTQPCPCGFISDPTKECKCSPQQVQKYVNRLSGPLLDRIDLHIDVPAVPIRELARRESDGEPSAAIRARVNAARDRQRERYRNSRGVHCNAHLSARELRQFCTLTDDAQLTLENALNLLGLSARAYDRIIKVARTVADLAASDTIEVDHISEAIGYRTLDRNMWTAGSA